MSKTIEQKLTSILEEFDELREASLQGFVNQIMEVFEEYKNIHTYEVCIDEGFMGVIVLKVPVGIEEPTVVETINNFLEECEDATELEQKIEEETPYQWVKTLPNI